MLKGPALFRALDRQGDVFPDHRPDEVVRDVFSASRERPDVGVWILFARVRVVRHRDRLGPGPHVPADKDRNAGYRIKMVGTPGLSLVTGNQREGLEI